jgi:hypothetical protein
MSLARETYILWNAFHMDSSHQETIDAIAETRNKGGLTYVNAAAIPAKLVVTLHALIVRAR